MGSSRPLPTDIEDDDIWDFDIVPLSFEKELLSPTLVEKKDNELVIKEELLLKEMQVEEKNSRIIIEIFFVGVENFNFPIDFVTWAWKRTNKSHL